MKIENKSYIKNILILAGGSSPEKDICKQSGLIVFGWLEKEGFKARIEDPAELSEHQLKEAIVWSDYVIIRDEDGYQQKIAEQLERPFMGAGSRASSICYSKIQFRRYLPDNIKTPKFQLVTSVSEFKKGLETLNSNGYVLKSVIGGYSIDINISNDKSYDEPRVAILIERYRELILEEKIEGIEATVGIYLKDALPVIEIIPPNGEFFDYNNKYNGNTVENCPPKNITKEFQLKMQEVALSVHFSTGCKDLSRVDMILDENNEIYVLEINTIPGMLPGSLYPKAVAESGMTMQEALVGIINNYKYLNI